MHQSSSRACLLCPRGRARLPGGRTRGRRPGLALFDLQPAVVDAGHVGGCGGALLQAELTEQRRHVVLYRLLGNEQPLADLPVGEAFADQLQDAALVGGQPC